MCCIPTKKKDSTEPCSSYYAESCEEVTEFNGFGFFGGYGEVKSACCHENDGVLAVLHCDRDNISITWDRCLGPSTCIEHSAISGTLGEIGIYAMCEFSG
jgi:hypothetical protein